MPGPPNIFDRRLRALRFSRAARGERKAGFLADRAAADLVERLETVNRGFDLALELSPGSRALRAALSASAAAEKIGLLISAQPTSGGEAAMGAGALVADTERLPLAEERLDLIISVLDLHWVNDLVGALIQIRRALRPDGLFLGAFFGGATLTELRQALMAAEIEIRGGAGPRVSPFADAADGAALLQRAGFALPVVDTDTVSVLYDDPLNLLADLRAMAETNALVDRPRERLTRDLVARMREIYCRDHAAPDGRIVATFEIITLTGWAPHPDQQKPLRPGSARMRLADALGAREVGAGEKAAG